MDPFFGALTFLLLLLMIYIPWQKACTDYARQTIFKYRDDLFDLAATGKMDFNSSQYKAIRVQLETNIRYAHELTLPRMIFLVLARKARSEAIPSRSEIAAVNQIEDEETRIAVKNIIHHSHLALIYMVIMKSPFTLAMAPLFFYPLIVYRVNKRVYKAGVSLASKFIGIIQSETEAPDVARNFGAQAHS